MPKRIFLPHGNINITLDNDLVAIDIAGPCNTEFFEVMAKKLALLKPQLNINNYTGLIIFRDEALATPEAMTYFTQYLKTIKVRAVALNLQYAHTPSLTQEICKKAYTEAGVKHRFFFDNLSATTWLRECMATPG
jgi:hypothetical protein